MLKIDRKIAVKMSRQCKEILWSEVKDQVKLVNTNLYNAIESAPHNQDLKLFKAKFLFGDSIIDNGLLNLPINNKLLAISNPHFPTAIKQALEYSKIPLFLVLHKSVEVFVSAQDRIIPLNIFQAGSVLGLFETLDAFFNITNQPLWSVSAGARSLFMLPKISEAAGLKRLQTHFNLPNNIKLTDLNEHWQTFTLIANNSKSKIDWECEILIFTNKWFENKNVYNWYNFYEELYKHAWRQAQFAMSKIVIDLNWQYLVDIISNRRLKPPPYIVDQIKHIIAIAAGKYPAFRPAINEEGAPISCIQEAFINVYCLKNYIPNIMQIAPTSSKPHTSLYYSLSHATLLEGTPNKKLFSTIMLDLRDIKLIFDTIQAALKRHTSMLPNIIEDSKFEYFHVEKDIYDEIRPSQFIKDADPDFKLGLNNFPGREFCASSPFWRGAIKITT